MPTLTERWKALSKGTRQGIVLGGSTLGLAAVLSLALLGTRPPAYVPLYSNLGASSSIRIQQMFAARGLQYVMVGTTVEVPPARVAQDRMMLALYGLPGQEPSGLSSLSNLPFTATPTQEQAALLAATQGELEQAIDTLQGVGSSYVRLAMAQASPYVGQSTAASGSVTLTLLPGATLTAAQVRAIQGIVASAVPSLAASSVVVVNQYAQLLSSGAGVATQPGQGLPGTLQAENRYDTEMQGRIQAILSPVFGVGNVNVQVGSTLDLTSTASTSVTYGAPKTAVPTSQTAASTTWTGAVPAIGGAVGTTTNTPTYGVPVGGGTGGTGNGASRYSETHFAVARTTQKTIVPGGTVTGLTVSVAINNAKITPAEVRQVKAVVLNTTGFPGASVAVVGLPFAPPLRPMAAVNAPVPATDLVILAGVGGALLVGLLWFLLGRKKKPRVQAPIEQIVREAPAEETPEQRLARNVRGAHDEDVAAVVRTFLDQRS